MIPDAVVGCFARPLKVGIIEILPEIADAHTGCVQGIPCVHDTADPFCEGGDSRKIEDKLRCVDLSPEEHGDKQKIRAAVPKKNDKQIGSPGQESAGNLLSVLHDQLSGQIAVNIPDPSGHRIDADILRTFEIIRQLPHAGLLGFKIAQFFPVRVIPAVVCASGKPVCHRGHGEDRHEPRRGKGDHRPEEQITDDVFRHTERTSDHIGQRLIPI